MARYREYADLPEHIREMLRLVTSGEDGAAERYAHAPNKHLRGRTVMEVANAWFGQRIVERFLYDMGNYLGVDDDMERFVPLFGKKK